MPASAVFEASTRVMTEEEKAIMLRRVQEAKSTSRVATSFASESYETSYETSYASASSSYDASSSAYGSRVSADASDVDRIYKELTQKYGVESSAESAATGAYPWARLSQRLCHHHEISAFDADAFLAAFATDDSSSVSYAATASATESAYAVTTAESAYAAAASSTTTTSESEVDDEIGVGDRIGVDLATSATSGSPPRRRPRLLPSRHRREGCLPRQARPSKVRFDRWAGSWEAVGGGAECDAGGEGCVARAVG